MPDHVDEDVDTKRDVTMDLMLPFAACRAAEVVPTHEKLLAWAAETGLLELGATTQLFGTTRIGEFSSYAYPFADHPTRVLIDGWVLWTLVVDELFEEKLASGRLAAQPAVSADPRAALLAVDPGDRPDRHLAALADLIDRTTDNMSVEWRMRFLRHVALFIRSCHAEAANRSSLNNELPDLPTFAALRRGSFATDLFLDLVEPVYGVSRPRGPGLDAITTDMRECAADLGGWCNDLLSYRREATVEDGNNLVLLLARVDGCPLAEAVVRARARVRERAWRFLACKGELTHLLAERAAPDEEAADALRWALGVELLVTGSLTFQQLSRRWQER